MTRLNKLTRVAAIAIATLLLSAGSALAADIDVLGDFEIIIGDTGDRYDGWDDLDTRTFVRVKDQRGRTHEHYFDNIASAFFVLREKYGSVRVLELGVPEFAGQRHVNHGHEGHGLIDGTDAWYFWDNERRARGGLPLIMAFWDRDDAREMSRYRDGEVMDFDELVYNLKQWGERGRSRIYWRGWHNDRWDRNRWSNAWNNRWRGYGWDRDSGWALRLNIDNDGIRGGQFRYREGGVRGQVRYQDNHRSRVRGRGRDRGRDSHDHDNDHRGREDRDDRGRDRDHDDHDDDGRYRREGKRERNR